MAIEQNEPIMQNNKVHKKTPFIHIAVFLFIFLFLFVSVSYLFRNIDHSRLNIIGYYAEKKNTLDVVYIGGSACFVYWAPLQAWHEYGIASYNFACDGMQADTVKYAIKEVIKTQTPKLIIIDARPFQYRMPEDVPLPEGNFRKLSDSLSYSLNRYLLIADVVPKSLSKNPLEYQFDIAKYHANYANLLNPDAYKAIFNRLENVDKGFVFMKKYAQQEQPDNENVLTQAPVNEKSEVILVDLLEYCQSLDTDFLFVVCPYVETANHRKTYNYIRSIISQYGYDFLNTNGCYDEMAIDYSIDFYDKNHVNIFGAEKYTTYLGKYISDKWSLRNTADIQDYEEWDTLYMQWTKRVSYIKKVVSQLIEQETGK